MSGENINFNDKKIKKAPSTKTKKYIVLTTLTLMIYQFLKSNYIVIKTHILIRYIDNGIVRPLCIRLPQLRGCAREFDENATMSFIVKNKQLLKNYTKI